ncbi:hypothetical protein SNK03_000424 [Fusarium graminearum]
MYSRSSKGARARSAAQDFPLSSSQMSPDAAGGVIATRALGTDQPTSLSGALQALVQPVSMLRWASIHVDDTRVAWRLHWSQRLSLFSPSLTLRRSSFVSTKPIIHKDAVKVADRARPTDTAEGRGLRHPESRRITVISFQAGAETN